jgi:VWFA-related protein
MRPATFVLVGLIGLPAATQPAPPTFTTQVETVYLDAFVTHGGTPVAGLSAADFDVRDNGVRQNVRLEEVSRVPITATLAFDVSGSLEGERLAQLRAAGHAFVQHLTEADQAGLLAFSQELRLAVPHTRDAAALHKGLDAFQTGGETALYDALYAGLGLPSEAGRTLLVVFTDGEDNISWLDAEQVLAVAESSNTLVHVVGLWPEAARTPGREGRSLGPGPHEQALARIVTATGGRLWNAQSTSLPKTFVGILDELRARYLLAYEPLGVPRAGRHRLEVHVRGGKGQVRARPGYFVAEPRR